MGKRGTLEIILIGLNIGIDENSWKKCSRRSAETLIDRVFEKFETISTRLIIKWPEAFEINIILISTNSLTDTDPFWYSKWWRKVSDSNTCA